ncbi:MAG: hypothetical protein WCB12_01670 [Bryobacteraceae bacterium]
MPTTIGSTVTAKTAQLLTGSSGVNPSLEALALSGETAVAPLGTGQIRTENVTIELVERATATQYPAVNVYCEKILNQLVEKFRTFSGVSQMAIEVRHSQDRVDGLQDTVELYTSAVTQTLDANRGDWGGGMYYAGGYQVTFGPVKSGGRNFVQTAKVTFEIGVSIN